LPAVAANFVRLADQAAKDNQTHVRYLEALLHMEYEERDRHAGENRIRDAQLPRVKTLEEFDFTKTPHKCRRRGFASWLKAATWSDRSRLC
jgi:DNA replication protein DnaC